MTTSLSTLCGVDGMQKKPKLKYVAMCSGGKDSVATLLLAYLNREPLDEVVCAEVMFDRETSGEYPEHAEFIHNTLKPWVEETLGIPFTILRGKKTYKDLFLHKAVKGKHCGKPCGFLLRGRCSMSGYGKLDPIRDYMKQKYPNGYREYVGIAVDEPARLERMHNHETKISLLEKYNLTEADAKTLCQEYGLYSPSYAVSKRNGCWFCPNISDPAFAHIVNNHTHLIHKWMTLERKALSKPGRFIRPMWRWDATVEQTIRRLQQSSLIRRRLVWVDLTGVKSYED